MKYVHAVCKPAMSLAALSALVAINVWVLQDAQGPAAAETAVPAPPAPGNEKCTIEFKLNTNPVFAQRLPCHYSNYPVFKSEHLIWNTPKNAAGPAGTAPAVKATADSATISLQDDRIPSNEGNGNDALTPKAGHVYDLNSTSRIRWSGIVDVFTAAGDLTPVECQGGNYSGRLPSQYVAGSALQLKWEVVDRDGRVVHGTADATLNCERINLKGPRTALGLTGKAIIRF